MLIMLAKSLGGGKKSGGTLGRIRPRGNLYCCYFMFACILQMILQGERSVSSSSTSKGSNHGSEEP